LAVIAADAENENDGNLAEGGNFKVSCCEENLNRECGCAAGILAGIWDCSLNSSPNPMFYFPFFIVFFSCLLFLPFFRLFEKVPELGL
jgi:hypothetical protein